VVSLVRTDIQSTFPIDRVLDATGSLPADMIGRFRLVIINNPRGYIPNLEQVGRALQPGGRIIIQGNLGRNPDFRRLVNNVRTPPGFHRESAYPLTFIPRRDLPNPRDVEAIRQNIMGGPFSRTGGDRPVFPNYRLTFTKQ
jgi:hypothetical protein